ncbi:MAG TPA: NAD(P)-dependent oxidoreductase [Dermatophilaceae bacterium]|nr:NAD(P)-dependent oxidoreductase [Dermatophilaceae bacterium]
MTIAVTGAAGFVGTALLRQLCASGARVVAVDRRPLPACTRGLPGVQEHRADLLDPRQRARLAAAFRVAEAVVHLAGSPGVRDGGPDVAVRRDRDNVQATRLVCELTPRDTQLVVLSSSSVYGGSAGRACREDDRLAPQGGYARSKVAVEDVCAARAGGGRVLVVRPFTLVGAGQRPDMAVSRWASAIRAGRPVVVYGSLDRTRDLTCVSEAVRGIRGLVQRGVTGTVNLGTGRPRTLADLLAAVADAVGLPHRLDVRPAPAREVADTWADTARLRAWLGWAPRTDLVAAVRAGVGAGAASVLAGSGG